MPLSNPAPRTPMHTREVTSCGYRRADGLWDIEVRMTDRKGYFVQNDHRTLEAGDLLHEMALRVTVDDALLIHHVDACIDAAPHRICPAVTPNFQRLVGVRIEAGLGGEVRRRLGGVHGCTHLVELCSQLATTAIQTVYPLRRGTGDKAARPAQIDTCHALAAEGEVVAKYWPRHRRTEGQGGIDTQRLSPVAAQAQMPAAKMPPRTAAAPAVSHNRRLR